MVLSKIVVRVFVVSAVLTFLCVLPEQAQAFPITFNLRGPEIEDIDGSATMAVTEDGLTATLTAATDGVEGNGVLNRTASGFGINTTFPPGLPIDDTDQIDGVAGIESVTIMFDQLVTFDQLKLSLLGSIDEASLTIAGGSPILLDNASPFNFSMDNTVSIGQSVVLVYSDGNGFSFDSFTVTSTESTAVPEPATIALLGIGLAVLSIGFLWRRSKQELPVSRLLSGKNNLPL